MKHTPGPWIVKKAGSANEIWSDRGMVAELSLYPHGSELAVANASLIAAAPDLLSDARDTVALFRRVLETNLKYIPDSDRSGHPHGYSVVQIPDWEVKQKIEWLENSIAKAEGK